MQYISREFQPAIPSNRSTRINSIRREAPVVRRGIFPLFSDRGFHYSVKIGNTTLYMQSITSLHHDISGGERIIDLQMKVHLVRAFIHL